MRLRHPMRLRNASAPANASSPNASSECECVFAMRMRLQVVYHTPPRCRNVCMDDWMYVGVRLCVCTYARMLYVYVYVGQTLCKSV